VEWLKDGRPVEASMYSLLQFSNLIVWSVWKCDILD
jgi:hypothetical protein